MKVCISCSMPMKDEKDFPLGDKTKDYCIHCADKEGNLMPYEEIVKGFSSFLMSAKDISEEEAKVQVRKLLKTMPAWKDHS